MKFIRSFQYLSILSRYFREIICLVTIIFLQTSSAIYSNVNRPSILPYYSLFSASNFKYKRNIVEYFGIFFLFFYLYILFYFFFFTNNFERRRKCLSVFLFSFLFFFYYRLLFFLLPFKREGERAK